MKHLSLVLLFTVVVFASCKKKSEVLAVYTPDYTKYAIYIPYQRIENVSATATGAYYSFVTDSNYTTFHYALAIDGQGADDGYFSSFFFQAPNDTTYFSLNSNALTAQHAWYQTTVGGLSGTRQMLITNGIVTGQLQPDSTWKITIDVILPQKDVYTGRETIMDTIVARNFHEPLQVIHYNGL